MDGWIKIGTEIDTKGFDAQIEDLEGKIEDLELAKIQFTAEGDTKNVHEINIELEKTKNKLVGLQQQQEKLNKTSDSTFKGIGNGVEGVIKKVGKWALAIFGVRSAYMLIRRSMSTLSQYDDNLSSQLEYISWTIANAIKPVVDWLVNAVYQILQYVNMIVESLFGFKLFKGADDYAKAMKKASGSAKEIQEALTSFDEKNVLNISKTSGASGGSSYTTPQFKESIDAPKWMQWLFKNGKVLKLILEGIATAILTIKNNLTLLQGVGLFLVIDGIANTIRDIKNYLDEPTWENFNDVLLDIAETLGGIFLLFRGSKLGTLAGWLGIIVLAVETLSDALRSTKKYLEDPTWGKFKDTISNLTLVFGPLGVFLSIAIGLFRNLKDEIGSATKKLKEFWDEARQSQSIGIPSVAVSSSLGQKLGSWLKGKLGFASGGIINNPGRGVPLTSAIGGERGQEGIIPLTDEQAMTQLGESIGRYITIHLTNITELDGSTIARKVNQIQNDNNFVRNR